MLYRYKTFETVYLFNTGYKSYSFSTDANQTHGTLKVKVVGVGDVEFLIQSYDKDTSDFIFKQLYGPHLDEDEFTKCLKDLIYIFNKNQFGHVASILKVNYDSHMMPFATFTISSKMDIIEFERVLASTKLVNKKVKTDVPLDKLIYQTSKPEGHEYEWAKLKKDIEAFLELYAKVENNDLRSVINGSDIMPQWSTSQYKSGRKKEALHQFYVLLERLRQFRNRYVNK